MTPAPSARRHSAAAILEQERRPNLGARRQLSGASPPLSARTGSFQERRLRFQPGPAAFRSVAPAFSPDRQPSGASPPLSARTGSLQERRLRFQPGPAAFRSVAPAFSPDRQPSGASRPLSARTGSLQERRPRFQPGPAAFRSVAPAFSPDRQPSGASPPLSARTGSLQERRARSRRRPAALGADRQLSAPSLLEDERRPALGADRQLSAPTGSSRRRPAAFSAGAPARAPSPRFPPRARWSIPHAWSLEHRTDRRTPGGHRSQQRREVPHHPEGRHRLQPDPLQHRFDCALSRRHAGDRQPGVSGLPDQALTVERESSCGT